MAALRGDVHQARLQEYQKWDYITLSDFHPNSFGTYLSYGWLWFLGIVAVAVYSVDTFTAINLLAFNRWSSTFKPVIPLYIARWIFSGCILLSWVLLLYSWIRAIRVIRRGNVAESYLDPLAVRVQSVRINSGGQGFRRFLVFETLTKSKRGADYVALFAYFQFQSSIKLLLAEGPRQAVNALTLYSLLGANLGSSTGDSSLDQFWTNVKILYDSSPEQAVIVFTMLFTLVIWLFSALCFIAACFAYIGFLWHYIPKEHGGLNNYCRRKVDKRLGRVVNEKAKYALEREERKQKGEDAIQGDPRPMPPSRAPTLPTLASPTLSTQTFDRKEPITAVKSLGVVGKNTSIVTIEEPTLPQLDDEDPSLSRQPTLPQLRDLEEHGDIFQRPRLPTRSGTQSSGMSVSSFGSDRPLLQNAAEIGTVVSPMESSISRGYGFGADARTNVSCGNTPVELPDNYRPPPISATMNRRPLPPRTRTWSSTHSTTLGNTPARPPTSQTYRDLHSRPVTPINAFRNTKQSFQSMASSQPVPLAYTEAAYELQPTQKSRVPVTDGKGPYVAYNPFQSAQAENTQDSPLQPQLPHRAMTTSPELLRFEAKEAPALTPTRIGTAPIGTRNEGYDIHGRAFSGH